MKASIENIQKRIPTAEGIIFKKNYKNQEFIITNRNGKLYFIFNFKLHDGQNPKRKIKKTDIYFLDGNGGIKKLINNNTDLNLENLEKKEIKHYYKIIKDAANLKSLIVQNKDKAEIKINKNIFSHQSEKYIKFIVEKGLKNFFPNYEIKIQEDLVLFNKNI